MASSADDRPAAVSEVLARASRWGKPGRLLGHNVDLFRSIKIRTLLDFWDDATATHALGKGRLMAVYGDIWQQAAAEAGATVAPFGGQFLEIRRQDERTVVLHHRVALDDYVALMIALDKGLVHELLTSARLPVPAHRPFNVDDLGLAEEFRRSANGPCVVKPASGTASGNGVSCGVQSADDLTRAAVRATRWSDSLLIEEQGVGKEYRFLVLDGEVLDVVRRTPPTVAGDGMSTMAELVLAENERRRGSNGRLGLAHTHLDLDCILTLRRQGLTMRSVPERGSVVQVKTMANENGPADNETVLDTAPALIDEISKAARTVGLRLAGVDVITKDHRQSLDAGEGVVIEVNGTPGLHYHYQVRDPQRATPVASIILERVLAESSRDGERRETRDDW